MSFKFLKGNLAQPFNEKELIKQLWQDLWKEASSKASQGLCHLETLWHSLTHLDNLLISLVYLRSTTPFSTSSIRGTSRSFEAIFRGWASRSRASPPSSHPESPLVTFSHLRSQSKIHLGANVVHLRVNALHLRVDVDLKRQEKLPKASNDSLVASQDPPSTPACSTFPRKHRETWCHSKETLRRFWGSQMDFFLAGDLWVCVFNRKCVVWDNHLKSLSIHQRSTTAQPPVNLKVSSRLWEWTQRIHVQARPESMVFFWRVSTMRYLSRTSQVILDILFMLKY